MGNYASCLQQRSRWSWPDVIKAAMAAIHRPKRKKLLAVAGSTKGYTDGDGASAQFRDPGGLGIDAQDNIYVADINNNRIRKISFQ